MSDPDPDRVIAVHQNYNYGEDKVYFIWVSTTGVFSVIAPEEKMLIFHEKRTFLKSCIELNSFIGEF